MQLAYYPGCSLQQSSALYDVQSRRIFAELGAELTEVEDWNCCGATSAGKVDDFMALAMPARNIGIAEQAGFEEMVIPCSACYSRTLVAQQRMADDAGLQATINAELGRPVRGTLKVSSILEALKARIADGALKDRVVHRLTGLRPVCYYGCMMTRFPCTVPVPDDVENPQGMEEVLKALGIRSTDWSYKTACCGASAAVNDPATAHNLIAKILKDAVSRGANCFVVTCPMCQMNLDVQQEEICRKHGIEECLPVFFITEIIGAAMAISPVELQTDRHFVDGTTLLKELEQHDEKGK
jgi:heterodisulfide reductase subunit B